MRRILKIMTLILLTIFLVSCNKDKESKNITIYYPSKGNEVVAFSTKEIEVSSNDKSVLLDKVKEALLVGLESKEEGYKNVYNDIVKISYVTLENRLLVVNFVGDYYALNLAERLALKTGIAKSYSNFTFVEDIRFLQNGQAIIDENGEKMQDLKLEDLMIEPNSKFASGNIANYNLYFGTADGKMLYREERALEVQTPTLLAKELVEELIEGPSIEGLLNTIPKQTKIRELELKDGICYVDFSKEFDTKHPGGEAAETLTIYSIVNTLTELPTIEKVQFLIDGEKNSEYQGYYDFSSPFTRNSTLIYIEEDVIVEKNNPDNVIADISSPNFDELVEKTKIIVNDESNSSQISSEEKIDSESQTNTNELKDDSKIEDLGENENIIVKNEKESLEDLIVSKER